MLCDLNDLQRHIPFLIFCLRNITVLHYRWWQALSKGEIPPLLHRRRHSAVARREMLIRRQQFFRFEFIVVAWMSRVCVAINRLIVWNCSTCKNVCILIDVDKMYSHRLCVSTLTVEIYSTEFFIRWFCFSSATAVVSHARCRSIRC